MVLQGTLRGKDMAELKFPVTELDKNKFQVVVDMAVYAKESDQSKKPVENIPVFAKEFVPLHP